MPEEQHEITRKYIHYESDYDFVGVEKTHTYTVHALPFLEALELMTEHSLAHPSHGLQCECKDAWVTMANNHAVQDWRDRTPEERRVWLDNLYLLAHRISRRNY